MCKEKLLDPEDNQELKQADYGDSAICILGGFQVLLDKLLSEI